MPDDRAAQIEKLRQSVALLEVQQRELGLDFSRQIAELRRRLSELGGAMVSGLGAVAVGGGVAAGESGVAVGGSVGRDVTVIGTQIVAAYSQP